MESKELKNEVIDLINGKYLSEDLINEIVNKICLKKKIQNEPEFKSTLRQILIKGNYINKFKEELKSKYNESISFENPKHKQMLLDIWGHFKPNDPINMVDKKWRK